jgi:hypothetical protein
MHPKYGEFPGEWGGRLDLGFKGSSLDANRQ